MDTKMYGMDNSGRPHNMSPHTGAPDGTSAVMPSSALAETHHLLVASRVTLNWGASRDLLGWNAAFWGALQLELDHEHPVVDPHVSHFMQVPLRTKVKLPHSEHISPS